MPLTPKLSSVNIEAAKAMFEDIGRGNVQTYTTAAFNLIQLTDVIPERLLQKCVEVQVAVSGEPDGDKVWMGLMPLRVDQVANGNGALELQGDMAVVLFSGPSTTPASSGVVIYHAGYDGQNVPLIGMNNLTRESATDILRLHTQEQKRELGQATTQLLNALRFTVEVARPILLGSGQESTR